MAVKHSTESKPLTIPDQPPSPDSLKTRMLAVLNSMNNNSGPEHDPEKDGWNIYDIHEINPDTARQYREYFQRKAAKEAAKQQTTKTLSIFE